MFVCYLLLSANSEHHDETYIGFTVEPVRRLRQHNGDLRGGAAQTVNGRPWRMVVVVYGFQDKTQAMLFEWTWQHHMSSSPLEDEEERTRGLKQRIRLLSEILNMAPWNSYSLHVYVTTPMAARLLTHTNIPTHIDIKSGELEKVSSPPPLPSLCTVYIGMIGLFCYSRISIDRL
jgi:structure-specific endonuclease subunit SLX1